MRRRCSSALLGKLALSLLNQSALALNRLEQRIQNAVFAVVRFGEIARVIKIAPPWIVLTAGLTLFLFVLREA
ncbi:hypothetical protein ASE60_28535 [Ensifer sp. Root278]|nr:hypothetical protein ASE60_28535 [Ensifer sp. Root278]